MYLLGFGYIRSNEFICLKSLTQCLASCEYYSELIMIIIVNNNANGYTVWDSHDIRGYSILILKPKSGSTRMFSNTCKWY